MDTMRVVWDGKFGGQPVIINADDFNPAIHRAVDADAPAADPTPDPAPVKKATRRKKGGAE